MLIKNIVDELELWAPISLQESYDNCGLITGDKNWPVTGIICCLDATEAVVQEAITKGCNMIVAHHPIVFGKLKKITGKNYVERTLILAIKNDIAIYAIHTNLDNIINGVSNTMAEKLGLQNLKILSPKAQQLKKLFTYITPNHLDDLRNGLFTTGAGRIANYSECSFSVLGEGTFKGNSNANPKVGEKNVRSTEIEYKIEIIYPAWKETELLKALRTYHYYEEIAFEIISLDNTHQEVGSGLIGKLPKPLNTKAFLKLVKDQFKLKVIKHTPILKNTVETIAVCGGSGSFLIANALGADADVYITADIKYHEFFDADGKMMILDIGHYESEQFTIELIFKRLRQKFTTFAILKTKVNTNSVQYFV